MANMDTDTGASTDAIIGLAKDVGELKGIVSAQMTAINHQTTAMNNLSTSFNQLSAKVDKLLVYPVWAMALAFVGAALAFVWKTSGLPLP